jgi:hypothetical protein
MKLGVAISDDRFDVCLNRLITAIEERDFVIVSERGCDEMPAEKPRAAEHQQLHRADAPRVAAQRKRRRMLTRVARS